MLYLTSILIKAKADAETEAWCADFACRKWKDNADKNGAWKLVNAGNKNVSHAQCAGAMGAGVSRLSWALKSQGKEKYKKKNTLETLKLGYRYKIKKKNCTKVKNKKLT